MFSPTADGAQEPGVQTDFQKTSRVSGKSTLSITCSSISGLHHTLHLVKTLGISPTIMPILMWQPAFQSPSIKHNRRRFRPPGANTGLRAAGGGGQHNTDVRQGHGRNTPSGALLIMGEPLGAVLA